MIRPAMIRPKVMMPKTRTRTRARSAVMTIQPMFSEIAPATRRTHRATKNAIAFWRLVTWGFYATASSAGITSCSVVTTCAIFATLMSHARPSRRSVLMPIQFRSSSYHASPWRAETGCAWWLLCHPSPKVMSATHQLLVESSRVLNRRAPPTCAPRGRRGVDEPRGVQAEGRTEEDAPQHVGKATKVEQPQADDDVARPMRSEEHTSELHSRFGISYA